MHARMRFSYRSVPAVGLISLVLLAAGCSSSLVTTEPSASGLGSASWPATTTLTGTVDGTSMAPATDSNTSSASRNPAGSHSSSPSPVVTEFADNRNGSPVFADSYGHPVESKKPSRIPYGTRVLVDCKAPNLSGVASISAFYHITAGAWLGDYVVADTMTNGGKLGNTTTPNVDPRIKPCA